MLDEEETRALQETSLDFIAKRKVFIGQVKAIDDLFEAGEYVQAQDLFDAQAKALTRQLQSNDQDIEERPYEEIAARSKAIRLMMKHALESGVILGVASLAFIILFGYFFHTSFPGVCCGLSRRLKN